MKRFARCAALVCAFAFLAQTAPAARAADTYDIDVIITLTGPATFLGKAEQETLSLVEAQVNREGGIHGTPVRFVFHDDQTQPANAVQLLNDALSRRVPVVLGSTLGATCGAMAALVRTQLVQYCLSPAIHPPAGSFVFSASVSTQDFSVAFYRYFRAKGLKRIALISSTDASGQDADAAFNDALKLPENRNSGLQLVAQEHFNVSDLNVAAQMARIKAANPQVVVCYAPGTPFGTLLRGVQQAGIEVPIATGNANMIYAVMKQYADFLPKELLFPGIPVLAGIAPTNRARVVQQHFIDAYRAAGKQPDLLSTIAWDPAQMVIEAVRHYGPGATPEQIHSYIEGLHDWVGVTGRYDFRDGSQRGLSVKDLMIMRYDPGKTAFTAVSDVGGYVNKTR